MRRAKAARAITRIPKRYHDGMSRQIAVRLPEELVDFVDSLVEEGRAKSRAAVVTKALARERRRDAAQRDAELLSRGEDDEDMTALARYVAHRPMNLD